MIIIEQRAQHSQSTKKNSLNFSYWKRKNRIIYNFVIAIFLMAVLYVSISFSWNDNLSFIILFLMSIFVSFALIELIIAGIEWNDKRRSYKKGKRQLSSISYLFRSMKFGNVMFVLRYLNYETNLSSSVKSLDEDLEAKFNKLRRKKEFAAFINYDNNVNIYRKLIEEFSKRETDELKDLKSYLSISPKKSWLAELLKKLFKPIFAILLIPTFLSIANGFISADETIEKNIIVQFINKFDWQAIFSNKSFLPFILYVGFAAIMFTLVGLLFFEQRITHDHEREYLLKIIDRAIEIREDREENE